MRQKRSASAHRPDAPDSDISEGEAVEDSENELTSDEGDSESDSTEDTDAGRDAGLGRILMGESVNLHSKVLRDLISDEPIVVEQPKRVPVVVQGGSCEVDESDWTM